VTVQIVGLFKNTLYKAGQLKLDDVLTPLALFFHFTNYKALINTTLYTSPLYFLSQSVHDLLYSQ
jgi:hypothetical protein